jgi:hypothetical protein
MEITMRNLESGEASGDKKMRTSTNTAVINILESAENVMTNTVGNEIVNYQKLELEQQYENVESTYIQNNESNPMNIENNEIQSEEQVNIMSVDDVVSENIGMNVVDVENENIVLKSEEIMYENNEMINNNDMEIAGLELQKSQNKESIQQINTQLNYIPLIQTNLTSVNNYATGESIPTVNTESIGRMSTNIIANSYVKSQNTELLINYQENVKQIKQVLNQILGDDINENEIVEKFKMVLNQYQSYYNQLENDYKILSEQYVLNVNVMTTITSTVDVGSSGIVNGDVIINFINNLNKFEFSYYYHPYQLVL